MDWEHLRPKVKTPERVKTNKVYVLQKVASILSADKFLIRYKGVMGQRPPEVENLIQSPTKLLKLKKKLCLLKFFLNTDFANIMYLAFGSSMQ